MAKVCSICKKKAGIPTSYYDEPLGIFCHECFEQNKRKLIKEEEAKWKLKNKIKNESKNKK